jgi:hypothetical protein
MEEQPDHFSAFVLNQSKDSVVFQENPKWFDCFLLPDGNVLLI